MTLFLAGNPLTGPAPAADTPSIKPLAGARLHHSQSATQHHVQTIVSARREEIPLAGDLKKV